MLRALQILLETRFNRHVAVVIAFDCHGWGHDARDDRRQLRALRWLERLGGRRGG